MLTYNKYKKKPLILQDQIENEILVNFESLHQQQKVHF